MKKVLLLIALLSLSPLLSAQKVSVSTNILGYAALGTLNGEVSYSFSRRWSLVLGARYNPYSFRKQDTSRDFRLRQQAYSVGARLWPWHVLSGWWIASRLRYQEYNMGGILSERGQEGDRIGLGLSAGYTLMLSRHFNLEFALGMWGGLDWYRRYSCPVCGITIGEGVKGFVLPDDMAVTVAYVF